MINLTLAQEMPIITQFETGLEFQEVQGGDTVVDGSTGLAGIKSGQKVINDGLVYQASDSALPVIVASYSSHLEVTAGRNLQLYS